MLNWFLSNTVREASAMRKHVQKLLDHQRDLLSAQAIEAVQASVNELQAAVKTTRDKATLEKQMASLETVANKWLKPYPHAAWRENIEVLLVALAVAMGIRTFFLQPFKIPTGSMQPTLFGVTSQNLMRDPSFQIPTGWQRVKEWFEGVSYIHIVARNDGTVTRIDQPVRLLIFNIKQTLWVGNEPYTIWFPPDYGAPPGGTLESRAEIHVGQAVQRGEDLVKLRVCAGDHLFVDRVSYNFRPPDRGEIVVFETAGIPQDERDLHGIPGDQFYIKRLVGLSGEKIQISDDRHLVINNKELSGTTPHFEKIYSFNPNQPPQDSQYSGHVNGTVQQRYYPGSAPSLAPLFPDAQASLNIPPDSYMVMGDNTMNSLDSRTWGPFPSKYVIGRSFFVYWPFTERFGLGYHR